MVDGICTTNTRYQKWKDNVKKKCIFVGITIHALVMTKKQHDCLMVAQCNQCYCFTVSYPLMNSHYKILWHTILQSYS